MAGLALFNIGFRPSFLAAAWYSVIAVGVWLMVYAFGLPLPAPAGMTVFQWHAHEMLFGYVFAVIAGFLLTAVRNWTGRQTAAGYRLGLLLATWLAGRLCFLAGNGFIPFAALFDLLFAIALIISITLPIVATSNWRQLGILAKLVLLAAANAAFYAGTLGWLEQGEYLGIYAALYLVIGLILAMGGRVIPFFTERGAGYPVQLATPAWTGIAGMGLFLVFFVSELFFRERLLSGLCAAALFIVYAWRLAGWHTPGIWRKPLLWSLFLAYGFIVLGFLMFSISSVTGLYRNLALHLFAYGGIGLMTLSMMARVTLGHTGRNIHEPPGPLAWIFILLITGLIFRVALPMIDMSLYQYWVIASQVFWILAFASFGMTFSGMLIRPRADGQPG